MNKNSLSHNDIQNQYESSWIDDSPSLNAIKGLRGMPKHRQLSDYAEGLVNEYAEYSHGQYELFLDMLPDDIQNELARLYIESIDREIEWACYGLDSSINSDFLCSMLTMLQNDNEATRAKFSEITRKNILSYYRQNLDSILMSACDSFLQMNMNENGYHAHQDMEHGDITWKS